MDEPFSQPATRFLPAGLVRAGSVMSRALLHPVARRRRQRAFARAVAAADAHRDAGKVAAAADAYQQATALDPTEAFVWVQLGNMLKDSGRPADAVDAYSRALSLRPDDADAQLQQARAHLMLGQPGHAVEAYVAALTIAPDHRDAAAELLALGAGIPIATCQRGQGLVEQLHTALGRLRGIIDTIEKRLPPLRALTSISLDRYDLFRQCNPIAPPPPGIRDQSGSTRSVGFIVFGGAARPDQLLECLASITAAHGGGATVFVVFPGEGADALRRRAFADPSLAPPAIVEGEAPSDGLWPALSAAVAAVDGADLVVLTSEVLLFEPSVAAWCARAVAETGAVACYADSDSVVADEPPARTRPQLRAAFDALALDRGDLPGPMLAVDGAALPELLPAARSVAGDPLMALLRCAARRGPVAHVPRVLTRRTTGRTTEGTGARQTSRRELAGAGATPDDTIEIIIATRDRVDLLRPCIDSLRRHARRASSLVFHIVDTGSTEAATLDYLERGKVDGNLRVTRLDEPFNWSRANNVAARSASGAYLLFANNDIEMLAPGWDDIMRRRASAPGIGAVGGLLVYPDLRIQHAGIVLGHEGRSEHEARREPEDASGPDGRWQQTRAVAAVTGALLGCRSDVFRAAGGFDEIELPVWYNDVDFCLRLRRNGLTILYEPALKALHHESLTIRTTHGGDSGERLFLQSTRVMKDRWGEMFTADPYYNPHYCRHGIPFKTLCAPSEAEVLAHIRQSVLVGRPGVAERENDSA